ncbi:MAG TPA: MarR family transcriptional regulator [Rectinemataceae bacterium]
MSESDAFPGLMREWVRQSTRLSMSGMMRFARDAGISMAQIGALATIHHRGWVGVVELGNILHVSSAAASQILDKLVVRGYVTRMEKPEDRRQKVVAVTEAGKRLLAQSMAARQEWVDSLEDLLSREEKDSISASISILLRALGNVSASSRTPGCLGQEPL